MFDQILNVVKEQMNNDPQAARAIPPDKQEAVQREVATHVNDGLKSQATGIGGLGGLLSQLSGNTGAGSPLSHAIQGGLVGALSSKLGLPPAAASAIAAALPGILEKFASKAKDPNDQSVNLDSLSKSLGGSLGKLF